MDVIVLAGGLGTRLRSEVCDVPKCMAPVGGRPFLWYVLTYLKRFRSVERVILSVGYLREVIFSWVDTVRADFPFNIDYAVETSPLGTGGGIRLALGKVCGPQAVVLNGDTFFDVDIEFLVKKHIASGRDITLALKPMKDFDRYGSVELANGVITAFNEKQFCAEGLINGGVYVVNSQSRVFDGLPEKFSFEKEVLEPQCVKGNLAGVVCDGFFIDIGIPEDYRRAAYALPRPISEVDVSGYDTVLLDRDGTINRKIEGDYVRCWKDFEFLPGVLDAIAAFSKKAKHIFIVTNQRGVGRGLFTEDDLADIHSRMLSCIQSAGGRIDGIYCCTAVSETDPRRKPSRGMFDEILRDYPDVDPSRTIMIGDGDGDERFAFNCGVGFARV